MCVVVIVLAPFLCGLCWRIGKISADADLLTAADGALQRSGDHVDEGFKQRKSTLREADWCLDVDEVTQSLSASASRRLGVGLSDPADEALCNEGGIMQAKLDLAAASSGNKNGVFNAA